MVPSLFSSRTPVEASRWGHGNSFVVLTFYSYHCANDYNLKAICIYVSVFQ